MNTNQERILESFADFLALVKNPEQAEIQLKAIQQATKELQETKVLGRKAEELDSLKRQLIQDHANRVAALDEQIRVNGEAQKAFQQEIAKKASDLDDAKNDWAAAAAGADKKAKEYQDAMEFRLNLVAREKALDQKAADLAKKEEELNAKLEAFAKLAGR